MLRFPSTSGTGINCGTSSIFQVSSSFTLACWVHRFGAGVTISTGTGGHAAIEPILTGGLGESEVIGLNFPFFLGFVPSASKFCADFEDINNGLNHPHVFTNNSGSHGWPVHVCVTYTNSSSLNTGSWKSYINGVLDRTTTITNTNANIRTVDSGSRQFACIATAATSNGVRSGAWLGVVSEACIWNADLSESEVNMLANSKISGIALQIRSGSLQGYWPLNEVASGSTLTSGATRTVLNRGPFPRNGTPFGTITGFPDYISSYI
jgi:hypothetical protein